MIRLDRPPSQFYPIKYTSGLKKGLNKLFRQYNSAPGDFDSGKKKFKFKQDLYRNPTVTKKLQDAQHQKCIYCESRLGSSSHAEVEHFRPKAAYQDFRGQPLSYPGYYWLTYDWHTYFSVVRFATTTKATYSLCKILILEPKITFTSLQKKRQL